MTCSLIFYLTGTRMGQEESAVWRDSHFAGVGCAAFVDKLIAAVARLTKLHARGFDMAFLQLIGF